MCVPEDASTGEAPHSAASDASPPSRCGLPPAVASNAAATSAPIPETSSSSGAAWATSRPSSRSSSVISSRERLPASAQATQREPCAGVGCVDAASGQLGFGCGLGQPTVGQMPQLAAQRAGCGHGHGVRLARCLGARLIAERRASRSIRMARRGRLGTWAGRTPRRPAPRGRRPRRRQGQACRAAAAWPGLAGRPRAPPPAGLAGGGSSPRPMSRCPPPRSGTPARTRAARPATADSPTVWPRAWRLRGCARWRWPRSRHGGLRGCQRRRRSLTARVVSCWSRLSLVVEAQGMACASGGGQASDEPVGTGSYQVTATSGECPQGAPSSVDSSQEGHRPARAGQARIESHRAGAPCSSIITGQDLGRIRPTSWPQPAHTTPAARSGLARPTAKLQVSAVRTAHPGICAARCSRNALKAPQRHRRPTVGLALMQQTRRAAARWAA